MDAGAIALSNNREEALIFPRPKVADAVTSAVDATAWGGRISPQNTQNDIDDSDPQALFSHVVKSLANRAAYLHIIEGDTSGNPVPPFDYLALKRLFGGSDTRQCCPPSRDAR